MRYIAPKPHPEDRTTPHRSNPFFTLVLLLLVLVGGYKLISQRLNHNQIISQQLASTDTAAEDAETTEPPAEQTWIHYKVKRGDTMAKIFNNLNLDPQDLHSIMKLNDNRGTLTNLSVDQQVDVLVSDNPEPNSTYKILRALHLKLNLRDTLIIQRSGDTYTTEIYQQPIETQTVIASATITSSFLAAGSKAEIPQAVLQQIIGLFSWRIDFSRDIRAGDRFTVAYEEQYLDGKKLKSGDIIAAEFVNKGTAYYAINYPDTNANSRYYDSTGASVRKAFLRRPVNPSRISSPFNLRRKHPILGYVRPHTGTDLAAPYGTPIHATGDGYIMFMNRKGGYGRTVIIRHGTQILTLYAHMSRYATNLRVGQYVKQNQIIGYIGTSGLSSGPHVHYEFRINGKFYDPMKVKLPTASPVPKDELNKYLAYAQTEIEKLNRYHPGSPAPTNRS